jgi:N-acetylmuramoyl-L-alanine amidase
MFSNIFKPKTLQQNTLSWKNKDITIILDAGHGKNTLGKCSPKWPDGS